LKEETFSAIPFINDTVVKWQNVLGLSKDEAVKTMSVTVDSLPS